MAKYTITLDETLALLDADQLAAYNAYWAIFVTNQDYRTNIKTAFENINRDREITAGTPAGFLLDFSGAVYKYAPEINDLISQFSASGAFEKTHIVEERTDTETHTGTEGESSTDTAQTETSGTATPGASTTITSKNVFSDTPQSSGVIDSGYASSVDEANNTTTHSGSDQTTGSENKSGSSSRNKTRNLSDALSSIVRGTIDDGTTSHIVLSGVGYIGTVVMTILDTCFIGLY